MTADPSKDSSAILELRGISKSFGETQALENASLTLLPGEIHALLGENGAGKSTLVSIAGGLLRADAGAVSLRGREVSFPTPREARRGGIALVPQHDLLVEAATVADNLALLDPSTPWLEPPAARRERVRLLAAAFALDLGTPDALVADLPVGTRQRIEIAGALASDPEILILDEPTAVLAPDEASSLFASLRRRADAGKAVLLITHRLAEVFQAADRLTLLARGRTIKSCAVSETRPEEIGSLLIAGAQRTLEKAREGEREREKVFLDREDRPAVLELRDVVPLARPGERLAAVPPASLTVRAGELVVLLAIDGNGADTLAACAAGLRGFTGRIALGGEELTPGAPRAFRAAGGRFVPADRRAEGLVASLTLEENLALPSPPGRFLLDRDAMRRGAEERLARFGIRAASSSSRAATLSGGNQQKLVLARELDARLGRPRLLVTIHPTRGLDLSAASEVRDLFEAGRRAGCAVLIVSADPDEARLFGGTFHVVYRGRLSEPLPPDTPLPALGRRMAGLAA
jgi:ABC-type uncharacterized transport system ATPase subunit